LISREKGADSGTNRQNIVLPQNKCSFCEKSAISAKIIAA
jgi:hypothetical protein